MSLLLNGDCLELMKDLDDESVDLIFCDLPYGQTSCKWDCCIDLDKFWVEVMRIKKLNTPIFFTTTTKFGVSLINSAPKKCHFRYDIVWVKSAPAGFLSAKKMPMRKHEMIYVFYEKLPFYDLSSHKHKFIKETEEKYVTHKLYGNGGKDTQNKSEGIKKVLYKESKYEPPLPVSIVKEETGGATGKELDEKYKNKGGLYSKVSRNGLLKAEPHYDPPLPVSIVKEEEKQIIKGDHNTYNTAGRKKPIVREKAGKYETPLPVSVVEENNTNKNSELYGQIKGNGYSSQERKGSVFDPPLPNSMLEIKSTRGKHSTEKPVALMEWILKYYSKEGDVVLDPTMGSGSTGIACKNMNRNFIGMEMDDEIYDFAVNRIN